MKKSFGALVVLLVLLLATGARAVLGLTVEKAFKAMQTASKETGFLIDLDAAQKECKVLCTATEEIDKGTHLQVSFDEKTRAVREITLFVQVVYKDQDAMLDAIIRGGYVFRAGYSLKMLLRLAKPDLTDAQNANLQKRVGIINEDVQQGKKRDAIVGKAKVSGIFLQGVYIVNIGTAE